MSFRPSLAISVLAASVPCSPVSCGTRTFVGLLERYRTPAIAAATTSGTASAAHHGSDDGALGCRGRGHAQIPASSLSLGAAWRSNRNLHVLFVVPGGSAVWNQVHRRRGNRDPNPGNALDGELVVVDDTALVPDGRD